MNPTKYNRSLGNPPPPQRRYNYVFNGYDAAVPGNYHPLTGHPCRVIRGWARGVGTYNAAVRTPAALAVAAYVAAGVFDEPWRGWYYFVNNGLVYGTELEVEVHEMEELSELLPSQEPF